MFDRLLRFQIKISNKEREFREREGLVGAYGLNEREELLKLPIPDF